MSKALLSDPVALTLPLDVLDDIAAIAKASDRTRSWVIVRALKLYLAGEGAECLATIRGRAEALAGGGSSSDEMLAELNQILGGQKPGETS